MIDVSVCSLFDEMFIIPSCVSTPWQCRSSLDQFCLIIPWRFLFNAHEIGCVRLKGVAVD